VAGELENVLGRTSSLAASNYMTKNENEKLNINAVKSVVVISAHSDDNMACAGTLMKLKAKGYELFEVVLTDSSEGRDFRNPNGKKGREVTEVRNSELDKAAKLIGISKVFNMGQADLGLLYSKELMLKIAGIIRKVRPSIGIIMNSNDWHPDHREVNKIGSEAFKWAGTNVRPELGEAWRTPVVLCSEGTIPVQVNVLVDVTKYAEEKMELWKIYASQASSTAINFDNSLMTVRGYQLRRKGSQMAEAFTTDPTSPAIMFDD